MNLDVFGAITILSTMSEHFQENHGTKEPYNTAVNMAIDALISMGSKRLTKEERNIMRSVGARYAAVASYYADGEPTFTNVVLLYKNKPELDGEGAVVIDGCNEAIASVNKELFPSLKSGECIGVEE